MKNKRGFTLIELLTVIAILGILVLLAAPKFLGYTEKANIAKIQTGIKAVETAIDLKSLEDPEFTEGLVAITSDRLQEINDSGKLIDKNGFIKEDLEGGKNVPLKDLNVKWNSGGEFIINPEDDSVYYYNKDINVSKNSDGSATIPGDNNGDGDNSENTEPPVTEPEITYPIIHENGDKEDEDGTITKPDGTVILPDGTVIPVTSELNFTWVNSTQGYTATGQSEKGYYSYTGTGEEVVNIPHVINGTEMTSYLSMFQGSGADVKKVISTNPNITGMSFMFAFAQATSLDLSSFDTSNVTNMDGMFYESRATSISGLTNFNTSKVTDMSYMFFNLPATSLDLSSFDTSKVTNMDRMFANAQATTLDLSSFDTSNVTDMTGMFVNSQATSLEISSFDTSNVTTMSSMFNNLRATSLDLSLFDTSNVTDMRWMFEDSKAITLDLSSFDTSKTSVEQMYSMFKDSQTTTGYARTQADADKLNASSIKPDGLTFTVK